MSSIFWGILHGWSVATPWDGQAVWWLELVALAWLVRRLSVSSNAVPGNTKEAALAAFPFAIAWFTSSMWWLYTSMHDYGGLAAPVAALAVLALCALLASFYAAACAAYVHLKTDRPLLNAMLFAALWLLAELLRGTVMSGLPWSAVGYAHIDGPLVALAPYVGVYGISFAAALVAAMFVLTRSCGLKIAIVAVLLIRASLVTQQTLQLAPQATPPLTSQSGLPASLSVRLLQGNIPQNDKFDPNTGARLALNWYKDELLKALADDVDLVVTPETAIPYMPHQLPDDYWPALRDAYAKQNKTAALIGLPLGQTGQHYSNSALGLLPSLGAAPYRYDKHHLVPFGEFVPPLFRWFIDLMRIPLGNFTRGDVAQKPMLHAGWQLAPNICYEDLFGEELATRFANPTNSPSVFINISNMGWFAKPNASSMAIDQHLHIARMRTLEFDRPMIRATNTGATVIINRKGVITHHLAHGTRGVLNGTVERGAHTITPYAKWASQFWLWPLFAFSLAVISIGYFLRKLTK